MRELSFAELQQVSGGFNPLCMVVKQIGSLSASTGYLTVMGIKESYGISHHDTVVGVAGAVSYCAKVSRNICHNAIYPVREGIFLRAIINFTCGCFCAATEHPPRQNKSDCPQSEEL